MNLKNINVLVTLGPTWMPIDDMRLISNRSSGEMGRNIISELLKAGATVMALEGSVFPPLEKRRGLKIKKFVFFDEFKKLFLNEVKNRYDSVIHAAAVSDFQPVKIHRKKLASNSGFNLELVPTPKLIAEVKKISPKTVLVGFKLESSSSERFLKKEALNSVKINGCDYVVANSLTCGYKGFIFDKNGAILASAESRKSMARSVLKTLSAHFKNKA